MGLKRSLAIDAWGNPLAIICLKANYHDQRSALPTLDRIKTKKPKRVGADKGYDAEIIRSGLLKRRIAPCLIRRSNNLKNIGKIELREKRYCQQRWKVERSFAWLNNNRRIDRFMEKKTTTYLGFCHLSFIKHYLKKLIK
ncbi:MAG: transposase [Candidatus Kerfeldbacteria bacterium]|nr:transposase [Candidatus Kerfeldbacteria bacterium]